MRLWPGFMTRRRAIVVAVTVVVVLLAFPVVRDRMQAGAAVLETFGVAVPRPFAPDPAPETAVIGGVTGRLYAVEDGQAILVIPGATPQGVEDSRVNDVARSLTRSGRTVFIPPAALELHLVDSRWVSETLGRL